MLSVKCAYGLSEKRTGKGNYPSSVRMDYLKRELVKAYREEEQY